MSGLIVDKWEEKDDINLYLQSQCRRVFFFDCFEFGVVVVMNIPPVCKEEIRNFINKNLNFKWISNTSFKLQRKCKT